MKKIIKNQVGITLVEVLLAVVILGFIVSGVVLLSGSIMKSNASSSKESQAMAYATIISELIKEEFDLSSKDKIEIILKSTVMDETGKDIEYSIDEVISLPIIEDEIDANGQIKYISGMETGYKYVIYSKSVLENEGDTQPITTVTVTLTNEHTDEEATIIFKHNFK